MARNAMKILDKIGRAWCALMHDRITWPINGRYRCRSCWREYRVAWEEPAYTPKARTPERQPETWLSPAPSPSAGVVGL